ncbi:hypothetical protein FACS1894155_00010 [Bacteroidia bacterium]|nr:hypothetical protein FACS189455_0400 [Bacteroidia bacterium]GHU87282.1 hypothetical protein FACS1894155_00010 [Bacteroidia bacterium]
MDVVQYYDGLGRFEENVRKQASPQQKDIISRIEYDAFGREWKSWLPIKVNKNDGTYNGQYGASDFYKNESGYFDAPAYSENIFETSPLNRIMQHYGPGGEWRNSDRSVKTEFLTNIASGNIELVCGDYRATGTGLVKTLVKNGNCASNQLYVTKTTDENNHVAYEFRDKLDRVALQRQINGTGSDRCHDTYFVYDDQGNLSFVLPPLAADADGTAEALDKYGYIYRYDHRNRCVEKKLPGTDWQYFVYDRADRLIWSQDGVQRENSKWIYYKYDKLGRLILSGIKSISSTRTQLETQYKDLVIVEQYGNTGMYNYTDNSGLSTQYEELRLVNIYDTYDWLYNSSLAYQGMSGYDSQYGSAKGLLTTSLVKMADSPYNEVVTTFYYDHKGNVVQKRTRNHLDGTDCEYFAYSFTNKPLKKKLTHTNPGQATVEEVYDYTYDHSDRLTQVSHTLNGGTAKILASLGYDELGRLVSKTTGQVETASWEYNIRGWLRKITGNKFSEDIRYTTHPHYGATSNYNGNISAAFWTDPLQSGTTKGFTYHYDDLNRLLNASYGEGTGLSDLGNAYGEHFGYDKHGNMTHINRPGKLASGSYGSLDQIQFQEYDGNKVKNVHDFSGDQGGYDIMEFKNGPWDYSGYTYDANGNLTQNLDKEISSIQYNFLNLPKRIDFQTGDWIEYLYDASGVKLRTSHYTASTGTTVNRDYIGNKIYENNVLKTILTEEGYMEKNGNTFNYFFYLKDHLGNNRVVLNNSGAAVQVNNYYPFGLSMWEGTTTGQNAQLYKYNGKELDRMHGLNLYDYGARMYDPAIGRFTTMDPMAEKYYSVSPYAYCLNNPVNAVDRDGRLVIFINGMHTGSGGTSKYWERENYLIGFDNSVMIRLNDFNAKYIDGSVGGWRNFPNNRNAAYRHTMGYNQGWGDLNGILKQVLDDNGNIKETIKIVTHSMGAAYAKGYVLAIIQRMKMGGYSDEFIKNLIEFEADFAPYQPTRQKAVDDVKTYQFSHSKDWTAGNKKMEGSEYMDTSSDKNQTHRIQDFMNQIQNLPEGKHKIENGKIVPY